MLGAFRKMPVAGAGGSGAAADSCPRGCPEVYWMNGVERGILAGIHVGCTQHTPSGLWTSVPSSEAVLGSLGYCFSPSDFLVFKG